VYGKIDRCVEWNGSLWPLDYKTASQISSRILDNFSICSQTLCYTLGASTLYGEVLKGMLIEMIRVSPKNDEVVVHPLYVEPHWLEVFVQTTIFKMAQIEHANKTGEWRKEPSACAPYGQFGSHGYPCCRQKQSDRS
jgi:hypothetical protein